jgi:8-amino-3,8-dideoxy-alpha-D-manno-octulosonate transaminase
MIDEKLAINGGQPVRTEPLPLEFPGIHQMDEEESKAVLNVLQHRSPYRYCGIDLQREVQKFEGELAEFLGVKHAVAVGSGTSALNVALAALGVGPGQEVIIPAYLWVSVVAAVVNQGAIPVLADIDDSFCMDPIDLQKRITARTTGVIVVHMSGAPANIKALLKVAREHKLFLVEDCAQCAGGSVDGQRVGSFGDIATFSFQMNKNLTSGEGGAVVTNDLRLYRRAVACHDVGFARDEMGRMIFTDPELCLWGKGCRLDELRASILRVQLRKVPRTIGKMHHSKYRIRQALEKFPQVKLRKIVDPRGDTGCFLITSYPSAEIAQQINSALRAEGIVTSPQGNSNIVMTSWGLHLYYNIVSLVNQTSVDGRGFPWTLAENAGRARDYHKGACPAADSLFERSILIAIPSCLTEKDEDEIIQAFDKVLSAVLPARTTSNPSECVKKLEKVLD